MAFTSPKEHAVKPFSVEDLYLHKKVMDLHAASGSGAVLGTVQSVLRDANKYSSQVWAFPLDGAPPSQLTTGEYRDQSPHYSPDGRHIAFLSDRQGGVSQPYIMGIDGGEARQLASYALGASSLQWAPDGKRLYVATAVKVKPDHRGAGSTSSGVHAGEVEVCWKLPYKADGIGFLLKRQIQVCSIDVESGLSTTIVEGDFDVLGFMPSPDGQYLAYTRTREGRYAHASDLWVKNLASGEHRRMTHEHALVMQPAWSGDSSRIAFAGALKEGDGESRLWVLELPSGNILRLGELEVADAMSIVWTDSDRSLMLIRAHRGRHGIVSVSVPGARIQEHVGGNRQLGAFALCGDTLVYSVDTPVAPSEVFAYDIELAAERQLSQLNPWWKDRTTLQLEPRYFQVPSELGAMETIEGWLLRAKGREGPLPLLNDVHGGPASYALLDYETNIYWQVLCSRGWAVLLLNAVGSSSFGGEFCRRLSGNWGELDLPQHLHAIQQLQQEGVCEDHVSIAGKSYGGHFTSWSIGHTPVFKAAVVMAPVGNIETHYGTSDGGYYADPLYIGTAPLFDRQKARKLSPLQFIEKARTPTLFLQGKDDERCPKCQSEELFVSLYRASDTPTELVLYPGEGHLFLSTGKPDCRADAATRIIDWLERYGLPAVPQSRDMEPREISHDEGSADRRQPADERAVEVSAQGDSGN
ncbi:MAG: peptidase [Polaromonas sp.]|nr:peptidase [Polaromonas sp.]